MPEPHALLHALPERLAYQIRTAAPPLAMRAIFARLPERYALRAELGVDRRALPAAAAQLIKLGLLGGHLVTERVQPVPGDPVTLELVGAQAVVRLEADDLRGRPREVLSRLLQALVEHDELGSMLEFFASRSSVMATLQAITRHMLQATDVDAALYIMLSGLTSGAALGFNRAALFLPEPGADGLFFRGTKAIGPADRDEAFRIWESLELDTKSVDDLVEDYSRRHFETRYQQRVQCLALPVGDDAQDELALALARLTPSCFDAMPPTNRALVTLDLGSEYVLAPVRSHRRTIGLIFADNRYDFVPIDEDRLETLAFFVDQTALVWENLTLLKCVEEQARVDPLTGVSNRRAFADTFRRVVSRAAEQGDPVGLLVIDVDAFKAVNDRLGHDAGDALLQALVGAITDAVRVQDVVARLGGDEFAVLLPGTDATGLRSAVRRVGHAALDREISVSIGAALAVATHTSLQALLAEADANLYRAKNGGRRRGCLGIADHEMVRFEPR